MYVCMYVCMYICMYVCMYQGPIQAKVVVGHRVCDSWVWIPNSQTQKNIKKKLKLKPNKKAKEKRS